MKLILIGTKGIVCDIGHGVTSLVSMMIEQQIPTSEIVEFGGYDLTQNVKKEYGILSYLHAQRIKEKYYMVPYERSDVLFADQEPAEYALPDGKQIRIGKERMIAPLHLLFDGGGYGGMNVSEMVANAIGAYEDKNVQRLLWQNIILSGGTSAMNGFAERFAKEIKFKTQAKTQIIAGGQRKYLSWIGGVVVSSISTFGKMTISKKEYEEKGDLRVLKEMM